MNRCESAHTPHPLRGLYRRALTACLAVAAACGLADPALAGVTIQGKVEYWNQLEGKYLPARHIFVEIEGDWWGSDPERETDDAGRYSVTVDNPGFWDGEYYDGVDIEAYAATQGAIQVFSSMFSLYPYHAISNETDDVGSDRTVTIDLKIGGASNNIGEAYYRTPDETANAFVVHQTMWDMRSTLKAKGYPASVFSDDVEVIIPAASPTGVSYTNPYTNFMNLAMASAGNSGTGPWGTLPTGSESYCNMKDFKNLVMHEYSHSVHDWMTGGILPLGLTSPSYHNLEMESNRFIAFTEGFAAFHPVAIANVLENKLELSRNPAGASGYNSALTLPATGDHWAMEGEIAGLLWDLYDGTGLEVVRNPATKSHDGLTVVPGLIVDAQKFTDRLSDPSLTRIVKVMQTYVWGHPVETIREFLDEYKKQYPADALPLRVLAYNRGILMNGDVENAPVLTGKLTAKRTGNAVQLSFTVEEKDASDRPNLQAEVWLDQGTTHQTRLGVKRLITGWTGSTLATTMNVTLPAGFKATDQLWLILNDELEPTAYRTGIPAERAIVSVGIGKNLKPLLRISAAAESATGVQTFKVPGSSASVAIREEFKTLGAKVKAFRGLLKQARAELSESARRERQALRHERLLYKVAMRAGGAASPVRARSLFRRKAVGAGRSTPVVAAVERSALTSFQTWMASPKLGVLAPKLTPSIRSQFLARAEAARRYAEVERTAPARIAKLIADIKAAVPPTVGTKEMPFLPAVLKQTVAQVETALNAAAGRAGLVDRLTRAESALRTLAR